MEWDLHESAYLVFVIVTVIAYLYSNTLAWTIATRFVAVLLYVTRSRLLQPMRNSGLNHARHTKQPKRFPLCQS